MINASASATADAAPHRLPRTGCHAPVAARGARRGPKQDQNTSSDRLAQQTILTHRDEDARIGPPHVAGEAAAAVSPVAVAARAAGILRERAVPIWALIDLDRVRLGTPRREITRCGVLARKVTCDHDNGSSSQAGPTGSRARQLRKPARESDFTAFTKAPEILLALSQVL
jgi:hypothetical protein